MPLPAIVAGISSAVAAIPTIAEAVSSILDRFWPKAATEQEKAQAGIAMTALLQDRENKLLEVQRDIIVAEVTQGDNYTKRARPTIVYCGLIFIFLVHVALPIISWFSKNTMPPLSLPEGFWWAWTGISGTWVVGRTFEKRGAENGVVKFITGGK